ncbi:MAG: hypothetical protein GF344_16050 [Chitinivibrionales bacterium]|nr:hypothetical protein [Chitinivibrionales bacterium]MBD3358208.1 hypothetical protein [Chitinivibrionales bacterium]
MKLAMAVTSSVVALMNGLVAQEQVFEELNEIVVIECESVPAGTDWEFRTGNYKLGGTKSIAGYSGNGCYHFVGNSEANGPAKGIMDYNIKINTPGTYRLYMRGMEAPIESGAGDRANDCYIRMVGQSGCEGNLKKFVRLGGSFEWTWNIRLECSHHSFSDPYYELGAGIHTFQIAGRSKNFLVDRFVLATNNVSNPKDLSLPESPMTGDTVPNPNPTPSPTPVKIVSPAVGAVLPMGQTLELIGEWENLSWEYDANSDGLGKIAIGQGDTVTFLTPTGITGPQELTLYLTGNEEMATLTFDLTESTASAGGYSLSMPRKRGTGMIKIFRLDGSFVCETASKLKRGRLAAGTYLVKADGVIKPITIGKRR